MYKFLLVRKYLRRKVAPLFAALAVMLCTAMVIIVISVMGGFLRMMRHSVQKATGQVTVISDVTGFPHYEQMLQEIRGLEEVEEATAIIRTLGLINFRHRVLPVEVWGIAPETLSAVTGYGDTLYWTDQRVRDQRPKRTAKVDKDLSVLDALIWGRPVQWFIDRDWLAMGRSLKPEADIGGDNAAVLGIEVNPYNQRDDEGEYALVNTSLGEAPTLTVLPLTQRGAVLEPSVRRLVVVNEAKSGLFETDAERVYVGFGLLQKMLKMDPVERADPETGMPLGGKVPGRASEILVRGKSGVALGRLHAVVEKTVDEIRESKVDLPLLWVQTWEQRYGRLLNAVENEKGLLTVLFGIISVVAIAMIWVIFYMIVIEKTRDIGVLRALGASRRGVMGIFLVYGLGIGVVGAGLGTVLAASIVWNLNEIQTWLYELVLYVSGGAVEFKMWDPRVYYFDRIPNRIDPLEVGVIVTTAIVSSVLASLVPAYTAGRVNPVESLRYE